MAKQGTPFLLLNHTRDEGCIPVISLVLAGMLLAPTPTPSPTPLPVIGTVKVATGSVQSLHGLPMAASLLDAATIARSPSSTGDALLRQLPGFDYVRSNSMFTNYGQLRVSFNGAGADRGLVLADGVPAQDGFGGQIDWAAYPANDIVRAELLRGPGSALYGSGAIGGVLSLQTFGPSSAAPSAASGSLSFAGGSHDFANNSASVQSALTQKLSFGAFAAMQQMQYDDLSPAYSTAHDHPAQAQQSMTSFGLRYAASPQTVFDYGYRGAWNYQQEGRPYYDFWQNAVQNALRATHASDRASLSATAYERNAYVTNAADDFPKDPGTPLYVQHVPTHESGASLDWIVENAASEFEMLANAKFVGGVSDQYNPANALTAGGSGVQDSGGIGVQETLRWKRAEFVGGVRADAIDLRNATLLQSGKTTTIAPRIDRAASPRAALRYDLTKSLALRAVAGGGFRAPYLNELVRGYQIGPIAYRPNPNLVPERSSSLTAGLDWAHARDHLSADAFETFVSDAIDFCTVSATVQQRCNLTRTQTDGTTLTYVHGFGACSRITLSGTQQYARITAGTAAEIGKQVPYVPKGDASVSYDATTGSLQTGVSVSYLGPAWVDDRNTEPLGTAIVAGMHVRAPLTSGSSVTLDVSNLTNARYLSSIDRYGPPQVISVGVSAPLGRLPGGACGNHP